MRIWLESAVTGMTLALMVALAAGPVSAAEIRLVTPIEPGAFAHELIQAIGRHVGKELGERVVVDSTPGDGGVRAEQAVAGAAPDGRVLLLGPILGLEVSAALGATPGLSRLTPVAKLASGISMVLVVSAASEIQDIRGFAEAAAGRPLRLGHAGPATSAGVARAFLVEYLGARFDDVVRSEPEAIAEDVIGGRADAALLVSQSLMTSPAARSGQLRPIVSFGAERSGSFDAIMFNWFTGAVPAFNEVTGDPKADFTDALAVFGPPGLPESIVQRLLAAFTAAGADPEIQAIAVGTGLRLEVHGPDVVTETMARDARVLGRLRPAMGK